MRPSRAPPVSGWRRSHARHRFRPRQIALSCAEFATTFAGSLYVGQAGSGFCLRGFKCEQMLIRCGQPTRYLTDCIKERGRFIGLSLGCNNEVRAGRFIGFVSAEHPLGLVEGHGVILRGKMLASEGMERIACKGLPRG